MRPTTLRLDLYIQLHYTIRWDSAKSTLLKAQRGVSFEDIVQQRLLTVVEHPRRQEQSILLYEYQGYAWAVPCVVRGDEVFLKTLYPSSKYTRMWERGELQ